MLRTALPSPVNLRSADSDLLPDGVDGLGISHSEDKDSNEVNANINRGSSVAQMLQGEVATSIRSSCAANLAKTPCNLRQHRDQAKMRRRCNSSNSTSKFVAPNVQGQSRVDLGTPTTTSSSTEREHDHSKYSPRSYCTNRMGTVALKSEPTRLEETVVCAPPGRLLSKMSRMFRLKDNPVHFCIDLRDGAVECFEDIIYYLRDLPPKNAAEARTLLSGGRSVQAPFGPIIANVWKIQLGESGRGDLKREISERICAFPHLKPRINAISKIKTATVDQLVVISEIVGLLTKTLRIAQKYEQDRVPAQFARLLSRRSNQTRNPPNHRLPIRERSPSFDHSTHALSNAHSDLVHNILVRKNCAEAAPVGTVSISHRSRRWIEPPMRTAMDESSRPVCEPWNAEKPPSPNNDGGRLRKAEGDAPVVCARDSEVATLRQCRQINRASDGVRSSRVHERPRDPGESVLCKRFKCDLSSNQDRHDGDDPAPVSSLGSSDSGLDCGSIDSGRNGESSPDVRNGGIRSSQMSRVKHGGGTPSSDAFVSFTLNDRCGGKQHNHRLALIDEYKVKLLSIISSPSRTNVVDTQCECEHMKEFCQLHSLRQSSVNSNTTERDFEFNRCSDGRMDSYSATPAVVAESETWESNEQVRAFWHQLSEELKNCVGTAFPRSEPDGGNGTRGTSDATPGAKVALENILRGTTQNLEDEPRDTVDVEKGLASSLVALMLQNQRLRRELMLQQRQAEVFAKGLFSVFKELLVQMLTELTGTVSHFFDDLRGQTQNPH